MMHIEDCDRSVVEFMEKKSVNLPSRTYNVTGLSFTPAEISAEIVKIIPSFKIHYKSDPIRQAIANSWPLVKSLLYPSRILLYYYFYPVLHESFFYI